MKSRKVQIFATIALATLIFAAFICFRSSFMSHPTLKMNGADKIYDIELSLVSRGMTYPIALPISDGDKMSLIEAIMADLSRLPNDSNEIPEWASGLRMSIRLSANHRILWILGYTKAYDPAIKKHGS